MKSFLLSCMYTFLNTKLIYCVSVSLVTLISTITLLIQNMLTAACRLCCVDGMCTACVFVMCDLVPFPYTQGLGEVLGVLAQTWPVVMVLTWWCRLTPLVTVVCPVTLIWPHCLQQA